MSWELELRVESTVVGERAREFETRRRALVAPVAGPVVVCLVHAVQLGEGEVVPAELLQRAGIVARVRGAIHLEYLLLHFVRLLICIPKLVI